MNNRERVRAILHYEPCDRLPLVHFGYWDETLDKWAAEGHLTHEERGAYAENGNWADVSIARKLGFDFDWHCMFIPAFFLDPWIEPVVLEHLPDGSRKERDGNGVTVIVNPNAQGIPMEVDHLLKTRADWEEHFRHRLQYSRERVNGALVRTPDGFVRFDGGGVQYLRDGARDFHYGLMCGSLFGSIRNVVGVTGASLLLGEDEDLLVEIVDTVADLAYRCTETVLATGAKFDFAHFWEDICFKNGPLVIPDWFAERVGPHYRRIADLVRRHGIDIVSLDCDGCIDSLLPIWLENGVNTMFPIEVGTWDASIAPWRAKYGSELRGVGGMDKRVFALDRAAVDAEVERLKPLVELGGYIPCPDHRIAPDAKFEMVQYYCDRMRRAFGGA
jgi:uroporphyrinogen decarboxylase